LCPDWPQTVILPVARIAGMSHCAQPVMGSHSKHSFGLGSALSCKTTLFFSLPTFTRGNPVELKNTYMPYTPFTGQEGLRRSLEIPKVAQLLYWSFQLLSCSHTGHVDKWICLSLHSWYGMGLPALSWVLLRRVALGQCSTPTKALNSICPERQGRGDPEKYPVIQPGLTHMVTWC
jgi:hypothetical protein